MNKEVNFNIAKLLKEKGFDKRVKGFYDTERELHINYTDEMNTKGFANRHLPKGEYSAPTIAEVIDWIFEKYEILITVMRDYDEGMFEGYEGSIDILSQGIVYTKTFDSPLKALEVAIDYTLN